MSLSFDRSREISGIALGVDDNQLMVLAGMEYAGRADLGVGDVGQRLMDG